MRSDKDVFTLCFPNAETEGSTVCTEINETKSKIDRLREKALLGAIKRLDRQLMN
jgi:hypothetical protein